MLAVEVMDACCKGHGIMEGRMCKKPVIANYKIPFICVYTFKKK